MSSFLVPRPVPMAKRRDWQAGGNPPVPDIGPGTSRQALELVPIPNAFINRTLFAQDLHRLRGGR